MIYKLRKKNREVVECWECDSAVPTAFFEIDEIKTMDVIRVPLCEFCSQMIGRAATPVDKQMLSQGLNVLFQKLSNPTPKN